MQLLSSRFFAVLVALVVAGMTLLWPRGPSRAGGPMRQQAYVWQRAWTPTVKDAVGAAAPKLSGYVVLGAEASFAGGNVQIIPVALDFPSLQRANLPIGLALQIGPYDGGFASDDPTVSRLSEEAAGMIANASAAGIRVEELQIDFDCAESKLDSYRLLVQALKRRVAPIPVTITVLPSWLGQSAFSALAKSCDGYILQVHSLRQPRSLEEPMELCNVDGARRAVEQAGRIGVPFRVALPTYSYLVAFDDKGQFVGLSAEGPSATWGAATQVRALRANPGAMAALVAGWSADRPRCMAGLIWYRLPNADDTLNWRMATLQAVMAGQAPRPRVAAAVRRSAPRLFEVDLVNGGEADATLESSVTVRWEGASMVAADALSGFEKSAGDDRLTLRPLPSLASDRLAPGDRRPIGWLRLSKDEQVLADVSPSNP